MPQDPTLDMKTQLSALRKELSRLRTLVLLLARKQLVSPDNENLTSTALEMLDLVGLDEASFVEETISPLTQVRSFEQDLEYTQLFSELTEEQQQEVLALDSHEAQLSLMRRMKAPTPSTVRAVRMKVVFRSTFPGSDSLRDDFQEYIPIPFTTDCMRDCLERTKDYLTAIFPGVGWCVSGHARDSAGTFEISVVPALFDDMNLPVSVEPGDSGFCATTEYLGEALTANAETELEALLELSKTINAMQSDTTNGRKEHHG